MTEALLAVDNLVVRYGHVAAVDGVSIDVAEGEIVALVGANGAGKTSLIRTIIGQLTPEAGEIKFMGKAMNDLSSWQRARRGIGLSPEGRRIFAGLTVRENLEVAADCPPAEMGRRIDELFEMFPALRARDGALGSQLSGGQQQMLAIGRALISHPRLLLLDEPSLGLAPGAVTELYRTIRDMRSARRSVLLAEQNVAAALEIADRVYLLQTGRLVAQGRPADLRGDPAIATAFLG
jgi:branched-chain amino acid transport system ATP-binding protein